MQVVGKPEAGTGPTGENAPCGIGSDRELSPCLVRRFRYRHLHAPAIVDAMEDEELRVRLAKLIVVALGVGTSKNDFEVINEIFGSFGASLPDSSNHFPSRLLRTGGEAYRAQVAKSLSEAAPTAGALFNEVVRVGGGFMEMDNEVPSAWPGTSQDRRCPAEVPFRRGSTAKSG
jgi:hypothetical protein